MESHYPTKPLDTAKARRQFARTVLDTPEEIHSLAQEAFREAERLQRSTSIKRGIAYAHVLKNNERGK